MAHRVVVQFKETEGALPLPYRDAEGILESHDLDGRWRALRDEHPGLVLRTLIRRHEDPQAGGDEEIEEKLRNLASLARRQPERRRPRARTIPDLRSLFFVQTDRDPRALAARLGAFPEVELAYWDPPGSEPQVHRQRNGESPRQTYLDPAPLGLGAELAWGSGGDGTGVGFVDLERGWYTGHPDLPQGIPRLVGEDRDNSKGHGTKTLGVISAVDNTTGVVGVSPGARPIGLASWYDRRSGLNSVENAIFWTLPRMNQGDVLLLEVQKDDDDNGYKKVPAEWFYGIHLFVSIASLLRVVVVAAAGNGGHDLDLSDNPFVSATHRAFEDSGSILVGAALAEGDRFAPDWKRWSGNPEGSNYGTRVDCFGMAAGVWTTVAGDTYSTYEGTSASSAMVAGAALALQGMGLARDGKVYTPLRARSLLRTFGTGTATPADRIGVMPDLGKLMNQLTTRPTLAPQQAVL